ncbi:acyl-CoA thioester hydrolase [Desulfuromusa kysingii]|uniref:Acyl-CoA thioester hydrolase n=1 Tax=Desulfuromusa kysingii TaxID=37625 RepID=A0A1H4C029_9BACT|nr:acyl-CoA thioesterase [Desulfuromusa kysingii]SEA53670.1 acyl-CoA thioester hydrolase [Desulfuromusa kysingii]
MPKIFSYSFIIPSEANDENGHVNNVAYVQWMQDVATMHSDAQGCTNELYHRLNSSWIVRSHNIDYLKPAFAGDEIEIQTWVCSLKRASSLRRYRFINPKDRSVLARAETDWVYVKADTGRPCKIDPQVSEAFILVSPEEEP